MRTFGLFLVLLGVLVALAPMWIGEAYLFWSFTAVLVPAGILCATIGKPVLVSAEPGLPPVLPKSNWQLRVSLAITCALIVVVGGLAGVDGWLKSSQEERLRMAEAASVEAERHAAERAVDAAIKDGIAIRGMSEFEVLQAKGRPVGKYRGVQIPDAMRQAGVVEWWEYDGRNGPEVDVYFDRFGQVIHTNDRKTLR